MAEPMKIMPVEQCGAVNKCMASPQSYESACTSSYSYTKPTKERIATHALQQLETARAKDVATHKANIPALQNNIALAQRVTALMNEIGMPLKYSERDRSSRARYPKSITHDAGYIGDLRRHCPTDDGFAHATSSYESLKKRYEEYAAEGKRDAEQAAAAKEREQRAEVEKRKADMELAGILLRYELPIESTWGDVLEHLRGKHQRLDLAVAMQQTRMDWSDGPYRVSHALQRFAIANDEDKAIAACVVGCLAEFEDGRVFRDTSWSYDALFASVAAEQPQLVTDLKLAAERAEADRG